MNEPIDLGPKLKPPQGGLLRLQQAVREHKARGFHTGRWVTAGVTTCLVVVLALFVIRNTIQQRRIHSALQQALMTPPQTHFGNGAYVVLPSHDRNIRILLVASLSPVQPPPPLATDKTPD